MGRTSSITMGRRLTVDENVLGLCFLSVCFLSCFGTMKFVITETLRSSVVLKTVMVSLHRGRFVVVHL